MRTLSLLLALSVGSALQAQTAESASAVAVNTLQNCPVGVQVGHAPNGAVEEVSPQARKHQLGLDITLRALDARLIRQAEVTVDGIAGGRVMPASTHRSGDVTERFTLTPGNTAKPELHQVVYTHQLTGVRWVQIESLTYADGTTWHQRPGSVCRVPPNGYLPVGAEAKHSSTR